ncbi:MAG: o-succinylbenzoate--CoA ligase [Proteobacteria bacterium]|nr:o-succinylbenzoate--CoA ligase [Pseudomonadota bacterium]MBU4384217.1 o-succinylbenzoate--CoA ligase [Pseudomonadota bacterium]MCG2766676.1 o-succinylbenzoate--CoA ligase [Desulfarculaceae bacterium]
MRGIGFWLTKREEIAPEKEAVVDGGRRLSYRQLNRRVNRLARALQAQGLAQGDRLALLSYNSLECIEVIMASAKLGLLLVPLNWRLTAAELTFQLGDSGVKTLIFDPELQELAQGILGRMSFERLMVLGAEPRLEARPYEALLAGQGHEEPVVDQEITSEAPFIIMYTAGTTGKPKGAVLTQGNCLYNALNLQVDLEFTSSDRNLVALPMFHIGGIGLFTLPMLYVGGTVVIQRSFDPAEMIRLFGQENITVCLVVPAIWLFLIQSPAFDPAPLTKARILMSGGAPLPVSLVDEYHARGIVLQQGYGMSEAAPSISTLAKPWALSKKGSVGRVMFHLEARVGGEDCAELPRGEVGELLLRGPNVMQGYWNRPEANEEAFSGGWFHTGDLARMDDQGFLYMVDRKKDMFISGGENVYPAEVENAIFALEQVAEAAVIGLPDPKWGEVGCAVVVLKEGQSLQEQEVTAHLKTCLAKYKIPKKVVFSRALPRNAAGKVLKRNLREQYS